MKFQQVICWGSQQGIVPAPDQILIAFVAKIKLYGFGGSKGLFAELLKILENHETTGLSGGQARW